MLNAVPVVAPPVVGGTAADGIGMAAEQGIKAAVERALLIILPHFALPGAVAKRLERDGGAIGQEALGSAHMMHHIAIADRVRAGGVVGNHAAQRGAAATGRVGPHHESVFCSGGVQVIQNQPRLHGGLLGCWIDVDDRIQMAGKVDDHRCIYALSGQRRSASTGQDRHFEFMRHFKHRLHIRYGFRNAHRHRLHLIHARIGCVERARHGIGSKRALQSRGKAFRQRFAEAVLGRIGKALGGCRSSRRAGHTA